MNQGRQRARGTFSRQRLQADTLKGRDKEPEKSRKGLEQRGREKGVPRKGREELADISCCLVRLL